MNEYPNNTDQLFVDETNFTEGAWLKNSASKFFLYSEGYRMAAEKIFNDCISNPHFANKMVYPMIFNYRQFIELRLKELISMGYFFLGEHADFQDDHSLMRLWNTYRNEILIKIEPIDPFLLNNVERIISQFNTEDPNSMFFRYPLTKAPNRRNSLNRESIDLRNFRNVIEKLNNFLDWQWDMLSHYQDLQTEMNNSWR